MTKSGLAPVLAAFLLLPMGSLATTITADKGSALMRREFRGHLSPEDEPELGCTDCPSKDYVLGIVKKNSCRYPNETLVTDAATCRYAANRANAFTETEPHIFEIGVEQNEAQIKHPHGCFHVKCTPKGQSVEKDCYFLNKEEGNSNESIAGFAGTPICERRRYVDGANNSQGGCPGEYQVVQNETTCDTLCGMYDFKCNERFRIGVENYSRHFEFPQGCFHLKHAAAAVGSVASNMTRVFYNSVNAASQPVSGTPFCEVASPLDWINNAPAGHDSGSSKVDTSVAAPTPAPGR